VNLARSLVDFVVLPFFLCTLVSMLRTFSLCSRLRETTRVSPREYNLDARLTCCSEFARLIVDILAVCLAIPSLCSGVRSAQLIVDVCSAKTDEERWQSCWNNLCLLIPSVVCTVMGIVVGTSLIRTQTLMGKLWKSPHWNKAMRSREDEVGLMMIVMKQFALLLVDLLALCAAIPCLGLLVRAAQLIVDVRKASGNVERWQAVWNNLWLLVPSILCTLMGLVVGVSVLRTYPLLRDLGEAGKLRKALESREDEVQVMLVVARHFVFLLVDLVAICLAIPCFFSLVRTAQVTKFHTQYYIVVSLLQTRCIIYYN